MSGNVRRNQVLAVVLTTAGILLIDQVIKIWVKTHMFLHEAIRVTDWWFILFTENNGMAFGMELFDKIFLTSFRVVAVGWLAWYIGRLIGRGVSWTFLMCLTLIMAGAAGNIVDCLLYGLIFNNPAPPMVADFVPFGSGYGDLFYGRVVDMFYFPLFGWDWPGWLPVCGGEHFVFFSPIFNFADASISCGVIALLLFCRDCLAEVLGGGSD